MALKRIAGWVGAVVFVAMAGALPAAALTTMEAPVDPNGARYAAPERDQQMERRLNGQDGENQRGFSIQVSPQTRDGDPNFPFDRRRPAMPWLPGQPFPSN